MIKRHRTATPVNQKVSNKKTRFRSQIGESGLVVGRVPPPEVEIASRQVYLAPLFGVLKILV